MCGSEMLELLEEELRRLYSEREFLVAPVDTKIANVHDLLMRIRQFTKPPPRQGTE